MDNLTPDQRKRICNTFIRIIGRKIAVKGLMLHSVGYSQPNAQVFLDSWNRASFGSACVDGFIDGNDGTVY